MAAAAAIHRADGECADEGGEQEPPACASGNSAVLREDVGVMDAAIAAVLSPTLVGSTLAILTITAAAQDRDQIEVPVGADLYLTRTFDPAKLIFGGREQRVRASRRPAARAS